MEDVEKFERLCNVMTPPEPEPMPAVWPYLLALVIVALCATRAYGQNLNANVVYVHRSALAVDTKGRFWLDANAPLFEESTGGAEERIVLKKGKGCFELIQQKWQYLPQTGKFTLPECEKPGGLNDDKDRRPLKP